MPQDGLHYPTSFAQKQEDDSSAMSMVSTTGPDLDDVVSQSSNGQEHEFPSEGCDHHFMYQSQCYGGGSRCPSMVPATSQPQLSQGTESVCAAHVMPTQACVNIAGQQASLPMNVWNQQQSLWLPMAQSGTTVPYRAFLVPMAPHVVEADMLSNHAQVQCALPNYGQTATMEGFTAPRAMCNESAQHIWQQDVDSIGRSQTHRKIYGQYSHADPDSCSRTHSSEKPLPELVKRAKDKNGSRSMQDSLKDAKREAQREMVHHLAGHVLELAMDKHGNHVVQKCIEHLSPQDSLVIFEEILAADCETVYKVAKNVYGCRVLNRLLEHSSSKQHLNRLIDILLLKATEISESQFGQHVICHLFEHGSTDEQKTKLIQNLAEGLSWTDLVNHKYGSKAIKQALSYGKDSEELFQLARTVLKPAVCLAMACEENRQDGAEAVKKALQICCRDPRHSDEVNAAVYSCLQHMEFLQRSRGGRMVKNFLIESGFLVHGPGMDFL